MDTSKLKSFWEKPEGTTGIAVLGGIGVVAGIAILWNIDALIKLAENTIYFGALCGLVFAVTAVLMNSNFRFLIKSGFESLMRAITGIFIAIDPIGILKNYLREMIKKMKVIAEYITQLAGQVGNVEHDISIRKKKAEDYLKLAKAAKNRNDMSNAGLQGTFAARELDFIQRRQNSLDKMKQTLEILKKMEQRLDILYHDTDNQVTLLVDEYKAVKASHKAMKGASELINGDDAKELYDQTCLYMTEQVGTKLGEMDRFMEQAKGSLTTMDLQSDVFNDQGLDLLANWEATGILSYESGQLAQSKPQIKPRVADDVLQNQEEEILNNSVNIPPSSFSAIFKK
jgi:phage shock protein A